MNEHQHQLFVELFVRNQNRVYRYILTLVPNRADAEELFQQTNLTLWKTWYRYDSGLDFVRWACGIAHNEIRNFARKKRSSHVLLGEEMLDQLAALRLQNEGLLEERRGALAECLKKLPSRDRELVERCYGSGETIKTVAQNGGQSPNVFYKALRRIRATLHGCVTQTLALEIRA